MGGNNEQQSWFIPLKNEEKELLNALISAQKAQGNMNQLQPPKKPKNEKFARMPMGIIEAYFEERNKVRTQSRMRLGGFDGPGLGEEVNRETQMRQDEIDLTSACIANAQRKREKKRRAKMAGRPWKQPYSLASGLWY